MKTASILATLVASASAFAPASVNTRSTALNAAVDDAFGGGAASVTAAAALAFFSFFLAAAAAFSECCVWWVGKR